MATLAKRKPQWFKYFFERTPMYLYNLKIDDINRGHTKIESELHNFHWPENDVQVSSSLGTSKKASLDYVLSEIEQLTNNSLNPAWKSSQHTKMYPYSGWN